MESQSITPTPYPCGSSTHELEMSSDQCKDDCTRTYHLYIPCTANATSPEIGILPLVYAIHCFGCDASVMRKWETIAQIFNFMLVRPEGVKRSWNSKYCCGYALKNNLNDVGSRCFLCEINIPLSPSELSLKLVWLPQLSVWPAVASGGTKMPPLIS